MSDETERQNEALKAHFQAEIERLKAEWQGSLAEWSENAIRQREGWLSEIENQRVMMRGMIDFALAAIRILLIVNGGSAVTLLALIGSIWGKDPEQGSTVAISLVSSLTWFGTGVGFGLVTAMLAFLSQFVFSEMPRREDGRAARLGNAFRFTAIGVAALGLFCFGAGLYSAVSVFSGSISTP